MDTDPFHIYTEEDRRLHRHAPVIAYWPRDGYAYRARGIVSRLDEWSVTVQLTEDVANGRYRSGTHIRVPRFSDNTAWSTCHGVRLEKNAAHEG